MGVLRSVIEDVESILTGLGFRRARENFTLEMLPGSVAHKAYTFGMGRISPHYCAGNRGDYDGSVFSLLVAWKVFGPHNVSRTYQEGYLALLDTFEELETALVKDQLQRNTENNSFGEATITPLLSDEMQDVLLLEIPLGIDVIREM